MWVGEAVMQKSIPALKKAGNERISKLPRIQNIYREKVLLVISPVMRICATSNSE